MAPVLAGVSLFDYHYSGHWIVLVAAVVLGIIGYLPVLAFTQAVKESPIGIIAPIAGAAPLVTIVLSVLFLNVTLHLGQWLAVIMVVIASIAISVDPMNWRQSSLFKVSSGIPFAVAAALGWGMFFFLLAFLTKSVSPLLVAFLTEAGVMIAAGLHIKLSAQKVTVKRAMQSSVIFNGILLCVGTVAFTLGVKYYNVGIVAALSGSTALVSSLVGVYMFREHLKLKERIAAGVMIASVAALTLM